MSRDLVLGCTMDEDKIRAIVYERIGDRFDYYLYENDKRIAILSEMVKDEWNTDKLPHDARLYIYREIYSHRQLVDSALNGLFIHDSDTLKKEVNKGLDELLEQFPYLASSHKALRRTILNQKTRDYTDCYKPIVTRVIAEIVDSIFTKKIKEYNEKNRV